MIHTAIKGQSIKRTSTAQGRLNIPERTCYARLEGGGKAEKLHKLGKKIPETERLFFQFFQSVRHSEDDRQARTKMLSREYRA